MDLRQRLDDQRHRQDADVGRAHSGSRLPSRRPVHLPVFNVLKLGRPRCDRIPNVANDLTREHSRMLALKVRFPFSSSLRRPRSSTGRFFRFLSVVDGWRAEVHCDGDQHLQCRLSGLPLSGAIYSGAPSALCRFSRLPLHRPMSQQLRSHAAHTVVLHLCCCWRR